MRENPYDRLRRMCGHWLPYANFLVQCLLALGLGVYTWETWKIRNISREQVETLQKPCLTLAAAKRQFDDAVLNMDGIKGAQIVAPSEGMLQLINVGLGPAFNVTYKLTPKDPEASIARPEGYLIHILLRESAPIPVPIAILAGIEWIFVVSYDSLTGRKYQTKIVINAHVLTSVTHGALERQEAP
jgi:hypothetical protein